ncbi:MAG TPA: VWA domain-containing protein [Candidatus Binatia bacterium]|nr:VWA domain-containing protein [Candidatus Binatia bacterium]
MLARISGPVLRAAARAIPGRLLKLLWWLADNSFVQRLTLITGLSLGLAGLTLAGVGEWAAGRFDSSTAEGGTPGLLAPSISGGSRSAANRLALPGLPEVSGHFPAGIPGYTLHREVPEVRLQFTVADQQGRLVTDLRQADVRVFDDQLPVARFSAFERDEDLPLRLGIVLDTSDSVRRVLLDEKTAASHFLEQVMRPQTDTAFVMAFGGDVRLWQPPTANGEQLRDAIARARQPGWGTRFFDALYAACAAQPAMSSDGKVQQRAIVVLTDGEDTDSLHSLADVIAIAQRSETQIYALTIHPPRAANRGDWVLQRLAEATGGRLYVASSSSNLDKIFEQIGQDLRTQYYICFPPQSSPGFHALRIELPASRKLRVHARQGYYVLAQ